MSPPGTEDNKQDIILNQRAERGSDNPGLTSALLIHLKDESSLNQKNQIPWSMSPRGEQRPPPKQRFELPYSPFVDIANHT